jgi:hypothetical protein
MGLCLTDGIINAVIYIVLFDIYTDFDLGHSNASMYESLWQKKSVVGSNIKSHTPAATLL